MSGSPALAAPVENVGKGLALALLAIPLGVVLTVIVSRAGFISALTSFAMAAAAGVLYLKGAQAPPRRGLLGLIAIIVVGVFACILGMIATDIWVAFDQFSDGTITRGDAIMGGLLAPEIWAAEAGNIGMFLLFALIGTFGTLRRFTGR